MPFYNLKHTIKDTDVLPCSRLTITSLSTFQTLLPRCLFLIRIKPNDLQEPKEVMISFNVTSIVALQMLFLITFYISTFGLSSVLTLLLILKALVQPPALLLFLSH